MNLGRCDVCLRVASAARSRSFYSELGFRQVEGRDDEGWAVVTNGQLRLGLFEPKYMDHEPVSLNFRGGDVFANAALLQANGIAIESGPKGTPGGAASATLRDPDGHLIFLDTAVHEIGTA